MSKLRSYQARAKNEDSRPQESSDVEAKKPQALHRVRPEYTNEYPDASKQGAGFLQAFLNTTPLFNLFESMADRTYGGDRLHLKVAKLKLAHAQYYRVCTWGDLGIQIAVILLLVIIAFKAAFKLIS